MDHKKNRILIYSDNYYFYNGLFNCLKKVFDYDISWVGLDANINFLTSMDLREEDIIIILAEMSFIDSNMLEYMSHSNCKLILASKLIIPRLESILNFYTLNWCFKFNELLFAIHAPKRIVRFCSGIKITKQEKKILIYTLEGFTVRKISTFLQLSEKTIYYHQKNALNKLGVNKSFNLHKLPKDILHQLLSSST
ncbi:helix-turn-helix transcriptional regulator [Enterobacter cloacae]|uniref:helix-turn-helix transcriptional regulator n=2 Tax=Enterobacter cloacae TaxID=550 RepID=UPI003C6CCD7C